MPCYDPGDSDLKRYYDSGVEAGRRAARRNSEVAELLCTVMKELERDGDAPYITATRLCRKYPKLDLWWLQHRARDKAKATIKKL